jgi:hypothetical protein
VGCGHASIAIMTAELAPRDLRGAMMATVFLGQGLGQFTAAIVSFVRARAFGGSLQNSTCDLDCAGSVLANHVRIPNLSRMHRPQLSSRSPRRTTLYTRRSGSRPRSRIRCDTLCRRKDEITVAQVQLGHSARCTANCDSAQTLTGELEGHSGYFSEKGERFKLARTALSPCSEITLV